MLPEKLPKFRRNFFISVSKAANYLGVSADTLRYWEKQGRLVPQRTQGGARRYALADLKRIKAEISPKKAYKGTFLPISKASQFLGISPDTLRNWEKSGRIESERTPGGARRYSRSFLNRVKSDLEIRSPVPPTQPQIVYTPPKKERNWLRVIQTSLLLIFLSLAFFLGSNLFVSNQELGDSSQVGKLEKRLYEVVASLEKLQKSLYNLQGNLEREGTSSGTLKNISKDVLAITSGSDYLEFNTAETLATVTGRGAATTTLVTLTAGATLGASLNLGNLSSDPALASNGALYYSTSSNKLRCYINGSWKDCDTDTTGDGDITAVGSMTSGDVFADSTADDDWLGLGSSAGRIEFDDQSTDEVNILSALVGIGDTTPDALLDLDAATTTTAAFGIIDTGIHTGTGTSSVAHIAANSATSGDIFTISATALTTGSALVLTGPSGGTAGVTDSAIKLTSDVGNIGTSNGLISSTATIDSTVTAISGVNLYLNTASSQALATTVSQDYYGIYQTLAKTGADTTSGTINSYGTFSISSNTGGDTAATRNTYGGYFTATGDASGTTTAYGVYASAASADNNYPFYSGVAFPSANSTALCWDNSGESAITDCSGGPVADYSEIYSVEEGVDYGEIVVVGTNLVESKYTSTDRSGGPSTGDTMEISQLTKSSTQYQQGIIGITSQNWGDFSSTGHGSIKDEDNPMPVALSGRVPVKISKNSEPIFRGDYITSSNESGKAMKATKAGVMIGKALEDWTPDSGKNRIMVFVGINYADPNNFLASLSFDEEGSLIMPKITSGKIQVANLDITGTITVNGTAIDSSTFLAVGSVVNDVDSLKVTTTQLASEINDVKVRVKSAELRVKSVEEKQATDSAQLAEAKKLGEEAVAHTISLQDRVASTSANLANLSSQINELLGKDDLTPPDILFASDSAKLAKLEVTEKISTLDLESSGILKSLGETLLGKTTIAGDLSVDGTFSISDNSINALPILKLQNSSLATLVDFFNGLVTINKEGTLVAKNLEAESVKVAEIKLVAGSSSGEGTLKANQKSVEIENLSVTPSSRIIITPTTNTNLVLAVTNKTKGEKFTVSTSQISTQDIKFDWLLINEE